MGDTKEKKLRVILINRSNLSKSINLKRNCISQWNKKSEKKFLTKVTIFIATISNGFKCSNRCSRKMKICRNRDSIDIMKSNRISNFD